MVSKGDAASLKTRTRQQAQCPEWFSARRLQLTATLCKAIATRRKEDVSALLQRKLNSKFSGNAATEYGLRHEEEAINDYVTMMQSEDPTISVRRWGLVVSVADPWLACSPDAIISRSACTEPQHVLLEVKCLQRCQAASLADVASEKVLGFAWSCSGQLRHVPGRPVSFSHAV